VVFGLFSSSRKEFDGSYAYVSLLRSACQPVERTKEVIFPLLQPGLELVVVSYKHSADQGDYCCDYYQRVDFLSPHLCLNGNQCVHISHYKERGESAMNGGGVLSIHRSTWKGYSRKLITGDRYRKA
jgi:hypothetical protein